MADPLPRAGSFLHELSEGIGDWRVEASPRASHRHVTRPVSRVLYRALHGSAAMTIHLVRLSPGASCDQPGRFVWKRDWRICTRRAAPIRSCSRWGLPCRSCCQDRGALLPHPFTLTAPVSRRGGLLSVALSLASRPVVVINHPGPWSPDFPLRLAPERPPGPLSSATS